MQADTGRCRAARRDGRPCKAPAVTPGGHCVFHDPEKRAAMAAARVAGGRAKSRARRLDRLVPASLKPTLGLLLEAIDEAYEGTLPPARANAMATLAGAVVRLYQVGVLEERLATLEAAHEAAEGGRTA